MSGRLNGKLAFITGAGQGIGRAIALAFASEGAKVIASSRTLDKMRDLVEESPAISLVELDVTDPAAVDRVISSSGDIDVLVNCAGWVHTGSILACDDADWNRSIEQNLTSAFWTIRAALPGMLKRGRGSIINVSSVCGAVAGLANRVAYGASKAALVGLTRCVAKDVISTGIRVNALCPGTTVSPSLEERIQALPDPEKARADFIARQPMGRLGTAEEIAAAALYLASDESAFTSGQSLVVDGGMTL